MWAKDTYQEQMLGYLGEVEAEIEQLAHLHQRELRELYLDLDIAVKRLWWLIGASDRDWEGTRHPLETSCNQLQRAFYGLPRADVLVRMTERHAARTDADGKIRTNPDDRLDGKPYAFSNESSGFTRTLIQEELT